MKRRLFKLVVFLLLGAVVNVAVAWGCVLFVPLVNQPSDFLYRKTDVKIQEKSTYSQRTFGRTRMNVIVYIWDPEGGAVGSGTYVDDWQKSYSYELTGWPMHCLTCFNPNEFLIGTGSNLQQRATLNKPIDSGIRIKHERISNQYLPYWRALPYKPLWMGFAVNSIFYSVFVWLAALLLYTLRLNIRLKRGRCLKCNYNLRGSSGGGCPECGWGREAKA